MDGTELIEPFARMLEAVVPPAAVRDVERGAPIAAMWREVAASGFLDALVCEAAGGAGLSLAALHPLWQQLGRAMVPLPVGETMVARALLADAGLDMPDGPVALAVAGLSGAAVVPLGRVAEHILVEAKGRLHLVTVASGRPAASGVRGDLSAHMAWDTFDQGVSLALPAGGLRPITAVLRAAMIAGAADRLVEMTVAYANERIQFGKPIGRQQALQQAMAEMAEAAVAARLASQLGCANGMPPSVAAAATAKSVASRAAARVAAIAHAVHGAIGISEEHDLQLLTRRLHEWRLADGSEGYWNRRLGALRLAATTGSVDFVRGGLFPAAN